MIVKANAEIELQTKIRSMSSDVAETVKVSHRSDSENVFFDNDNRKPSINNNQLLDSSDKFEFLLNEKARNTQIAAAYNRRVGSHPDFYIT